MNEEIPLTNWSKPTANKDLVSTVSKRVALSDAANKEKTNQSSLEAASLSHKAKPGKGKSKVAPTQGPSREHNPAGETEQSSSGNTTEHATVKISEDAATMVVNETNTYVHAYLYIMLVTGLSPYDRNSIVQQQDTNRLNALRTLQKAIFWYVAILSTWQSLNFAKSTTLNFVDSRSFDDLSYAGFFLLTLLLQVGFVYFLAFRQRHIDKMLDSWNYYDGVGAPHETKAFEHKDTFPRVMRYFVFSAIFSISKTVFAQGISDWSLEGMMHEHANSFALGLFYWTPSANLTLLSETYKTFSTTPATIAMGIIGIMADICWNLQIDCLRDLIMLTAIVNRNHIQRLREVVLKCIEFKNANASKTAKLEKDLKCWSVYRKAHDVNAATNDTFDHLLRIYHANGVMAFATFWSWTMDKEAEDIYLVFMAYNIIKILYTLFVSRKAAKVNGNCRNWIRTLQADTKRFCVKGDPFTDSGMLDELSQHPLGFGMGKFHIDDDFIVMFLTLSNAYLGILVKTTS